MNILVIGSGGREHALVWKLKQSPKVKKIFCAPGNGGIGDLADLVPACAEGDWQSYADLAKAGQIDLTVVGPEAPLAGGIVDHFRKQGLSIFGPDKSSARLEASKKFAKEFMVRHGIPTARYKAFDQYSEAFYFITNLPEPFHHPLVVKADGLAAGKGVCLCANFEETEEAVEKMMVQAAFGSAGETVLIEEKLEGKELSLMALCDGKSLIPLPPARDYKRVNDRDEGPNTGGMGSIAPVPLDVSLRKEIEERILAPFLKGIQAEGLDYRGVIYFGLMLTAEGPKVLEFNVRFGDPETQVVLPLIRSDCAELFAATAERSLTKTGLEVEAGACLSVVCASGGYPGKFQPHKPISGLDGLKEKEGIFLFHAGTVRENGNLFTSGGRVLNLVARGRDLNECRSKCYNHINMVKFDGMHYRKDIGAGAGF